MSEMIQVSRSALESVDRERTQAVERMQIAEGIARNLEAEAEILRQRVATMTARLQGYERRDRMVRTEYRNRLYRLLRRLDQAGIAQSDIDTMIKADIVVLSGDEYRRMKSIIDRVYAVVVGENANEEEDPSSH